MAWTLRAPSDNRTVELPVEWAPIDWTTERDEGRFRVVGRTNDVLTVGRRHGAEITLQLVVLGESAWFQLSRFLQRIEPMELTTPMGTTTWVTPLGVQAVTIDPTGDMSSNPVRKVTVTLIEQDEP